MSGITKILLMMAASVLVCCQPKNPDALDGRTFIGYEEDILFDSPRQTFQTILTFENDSVLVQRNRIYITGNDTLHFKKSPEHYQYKGLVKRNHDSIQFVSYAYKCGYCPTIVDEKGKLILDYTDYKGIVRNDALKLNGIPFKLQ